MSPPARNVLLSFSAMAKYRKHLPLPIWFDENVLSVNCYSVNQLQWQLPLRPQNETTFCPKNMSSSHPDANGRMKRK